MTTDAATSTAYVVSPSGAVKATAQLPVRKANAVAPYNGDVIVAMSDGALLEVRDDATSKPVAHFGKVPTGVEVIGDTAYVTTNDLVLSKVDLRSGVVSELARATNAGADELVGPMAAADGGLWWALERSGEVRFVPTDGTSQPRNVSVGCQGVADIVAQSGHLYAACEQNSAFSDYDLATGKAIVFHGGGFPFSLAS